MRVIISPAKKMRVNADIWDTSVLPKHREEAEILKEYIGSLPYEEKKMLWGCSDSIARKSTELFETMNFDTPGTPAILSYDGIQYQYMAPDVLTAQEIEWMEKNVRILSGFYGVLTPLTSVLPYRLEMQAKVKAAGKKDLYEFWGDTLYREVLDESRIVINLASKEYSKAVESWLTKADRFINCVFAEIENGKPVTKGVYAKMARGEMVRYMAEHGVEAPEVLKNFNGQNYQFEESLSNETRYVFLRAKEYKTR